jgi:cytochrome c oxidase assembly factor CtaG
VWGLSPLADQQLGGLIMWLPTNIPYLIALSAAFFLWVSERGHAERLAAGEFAPDFDSDAQRESNMLGTSDAGAIVAPQASPTTE